MQTTLCPWCLQKVQGDSCPHCGKSVSYAGDPTHLPVGYILRGSADYVLGAAIGQGGFGITYIALDMAANRRIAIKEYFPTYCSSRINGTDVSAYRGQEETYRKGRERFLDEARMLKSLSDLETVVNVVDFFEENNTAYLVMEFLEGCSLKDYVHQYGKLPAQQFLGQLKPLMMDMEKMHRRGVVHRDIAPDNIMMLPDGRLKLIDFGSARSYVGDKSMTVVVKKGFAPVEQYMRKGSNASTDIYALAATIYFCITGIVPPDSAERQYGEAELQAPTLLGADLTAKQERALEKALQIQPKDRTQSMAELMEELENVPKPPVSQPNRNPQKPKTAPVKEKKSDPVKQTPFVAPKAASKTEEQDKTGGKRKWLIPAIAAALLLCAGAGFLFAGREEPSVSDSPVQLETVQPQPPETQPIVLSQEAVKYNEAVDLFKNGEYGKAAIAFAKLGDYRDAKEISRQIWDAIAVRDTISTYSLHTVGIKNDGTVVACGSNNYGQCNVKNWTDIVAVSAGVDHTVGLKSDGTVVAAGMGGSDWINVSEWTDIVSVHAGHGLTVGIKADGSIVTTATGNMLEEAYYLDWTDVIAVDFGFWWGSQESVGLKSDGTCYSDMDIGAWCDVVDISTDSNLTAAVKSDGSVLTFIENTQPWNKLNIVDISEWHNIKDIDIGQDHILGLKSDGTVVSAGDNRNKERNVADWSDIVSISAGNNYSVGLKSDGTVVRAGTTRDNLGAVSNWTDIRLPADRDALLSQIKVEYITGSDGESDIMN